MTHRTSPAAAIRYLPAICWAFALAVAFYQAWSWRDWMSIDGVGYLDMADAFGGGVWKDVVNGVWSPLYPAVLAAGLAMLGRLPLSETQAVQAINLVIFTAVLASYEFLLRQAFATRAGIHERFETEPLPPWAWFGTARILFVWATAAMLPVNLITPDLLASGVIYLCIGLLLRAARDGASAGGAALLGAVLAVGYLAKAILFPLAFVFLGMLWAARRGAASRWRELSTAAAVFVLAAAPYMIALSFEHGRLMFSDAGKLNYAWHVNGLPRIHWQGRQQGHGMPVHPTRQISAAPGIYEFDGPVGGSVPVWYDPSYWNEGVKLRFDLAHQIGAIAKAAQAYWRTFVVSLGGFALLLGVSLLFAGRRKPVLGLLAAQWMLLIPVAAALAAYGLVHVEGRYIAPFAVLFGVAALSAVAVPRANTARRTLIAIAAAWMAVLTAKAAYSGFTGPPTVIVRLARLSDEVASELAKQGVRPGDKIATFTASPAPWYRLLGVKIVAHAEWWLDGVEEQFWALDPAARREIYRKLGDLGIKGLVLETSRDLSDEPGWRRLGKTNHYWRPLPEATPEDSPPRPRGVEQENEAAPDALEPGR